MTRLQILQNKIKEWSDSTFGNQRTGKPIAYHLKKEIDEVITAIERLEERIFTEKGDIQEVYREEHRRVKFELADCFILLLDVAAHENITVTQLFDASEEKMEINKKRKWGEPDENGVVEHIKE